MDNIYHLFESEKKKNLNVVIIYNLFKKDRNRNLKVLCQ